MSILAVRFLLAFLVLALIFNKKIRQLDHKSLKGGIIFAHELLSPLKIAGYIIILSTLYIYNRRLGEKNK